VENPYDDRERRALTEESQDKGKEIPEENEPKEFTARELVQFNGKEGESAFVAVDGRVYDVSKSRLWQNGEHMRRHSAGGDLTGELGGAPHGREVFERDAVQEVGTIEIQRPQEEEEEEIPAFLSALFQRYPILRRHPHPMLVHFPMAYLFAGAFFMLIYDLGGGALMEKIAFAMLLLGAVFTPPTILTGFLTWWVNYSARLLHPVKRKLQLAVTLSLFIIICLALKLSGNTAPQGIGWLYSLLMFSFAPIVVLMGYYGGRLTLPYEKG
jgi:predicted heme/steroid binding protein/uncharacterized membrane protein